MFEITNKASAAADAINKRPNIVLQIDGITKKFGSAEILAIIKIGDEGLFIDGSWNIGDSAPIKDQLGALSFDNSSTSIKQQLDIDKGRGSGISSMQIGLIDINQEITEIISPGVVVTDILGRKASVFVSPDSETTDFPQDYIRVFRGIIDEVDAGPGLIKFNLAHPDQKKRQSIFITAEAELASGITAGDVTIPLDTVVGFLAKVLGPDATYDSSFSSYIQIDDEIIRYDGISAPNLTGCTRAQFGTVAATHSAGAPVRTIYRLEGNAVDLALKVMASGSGQYASNIEIQNFNKLSDGSPIPNGIFFRNINVAEEYGITIGSYITTSGATNGANNVSLKEIIDINETDDGGSYVTVDGVTFVDELDSAAVASFRSRFDTLPDGLSMGEDEIDIAQHLKIQRIFLSSFNYDFRLTETIDSGKEWLDLEIYKPSGAYSIPRNAQSSVSYFIGPIPGANIKTLSKDNIVGPSKLKILRSISKNFANTIIYKYEKSVTEDKFLRGVVYQSAGSLSQIPVGTKAQVIESSGIRQALAGQSITQIAADRKLDRFKLAAEYIPNVQVRFGDGYNIELADIIILDPTDLELVNTVDGDRNKEIKMFEVNNITKDFKTGKITIDLLDTTFDGAKRYGLIGPSSRISSGASQTQFQIEEFFPGSPFGAAEYKKWDRYPLCAVKVRSEDFTTRFAQTVIQSVSGNTITVSPALGFTPQPGDVMELADYDFASVTEQIKLIYVHMQNNATFGDGKDQYVML